MSVRGELAALIMRAYREGGDAYRAADAILAAGWINPNVPEATAIYPELPED